MPLTKSFSSIVSDIIDNVLISNPSADIKIGEVIRDVFIDVQALQIQNIYSLADGAARAQSILTARNQQLDRLAYNVNLTRQQAGSSSAVIVISVKSGVTAPTLLNVGDQFFTLSDSQTTTQTFINTIPTLLSPGQNQISLVVVNVQAGSQGNVAANTITQSSYDFADEVYNPAPATGGTDIESDASLAQRIPLQISGQFLNTYKGISNVTQNVSDLNGTPYIVTPDNPLSRGQYTTDVYLQVNSNYQGTPIQENAPANSATYVFQQQPIYHLNPINSLSVFNPLTNSYVSLPAVSATGNVNYKLVEDPSDVQGLYVGTTKAATQLQWVTSPPSASYIISYNYDHTIVDAQSAYDINTEVTNDLLFKQSIAVPIYVTANLIAVQGADLVTLYQNAQLNLAALFNGLNIGQPLTTTELEVAFLQDNNIYDVDLTNLDSTYQVSLNLNDITSSNTQINSQILPLAAYYEPLTTGTGNFSQFTVAGRLWIGDPKAIIAVQPFNFSLGAYNGVPSEETINSITVSGTNWTPQVYKFYDPITETLVINFSTPPPTDGSAVVNFNILNNNIQTGNSLTYLSLAPSIIAPVQLFTNNNSATSPQYVTVLPNDLNGNQITFEEANLYKNGVLLSRGSNTNAGDYQITAPDPITGVIQIAFSQSSAPGPLDILEYGLLNPNISVSYTTAQFV